jgi:hypothetical protein
MKEALGFSETSVLTRATRRNIPEDTILQNQESVFSARIRWASRPSGFLSSSYQGSSIQGKTASFKDGSLSTPNPEAENVFTYFYTKCFNEPNFPATFPNLIIIIIIIIIIIWIASVVYWSDFLATVPEVPRSIPRAIRFSE